MIRQATSDDLRAIEAFLPPILKEMEAVGNDQWSAAYPTRQDFARDVAEGSLFVEVGEQVRGMVCLNLEEPPEYAPLPWAITAPSLVLHRMAVGPSARGQGVAHAMLAFADEHARRLGTGYLRSDTYSKNPVMNGLFAAHGWTFRGTLRFPGRAHDFRAYDKVVGSALPSAHARTPT